MAEDVDRNRLVVAGRRDPLIHAESTMDTERVR
jgi:hypothetical protein